MKTFLSFVQEFLFESKHATFDHEGKSVTINGDSPDEHIEAAMNHPHAGTRAFGARHSRNPDSIRNLHGKEKDWWVLKELGKNPNTPDDVLEKLRNHSNGKVRASVEERGSQPVAKPSPVAKQKKEPSQPIQKKKMPSGFDFGSSMMKQQGHKWEYSAKKSAPEAVKPSKPVAKKPAAASTKASFGVEKVNPEESQLGYDAESIHHITKNGKVVGAVTVSRHEDDPKKKTVKSWHGHPDKGFEPAGTHSDINDAVSSIVKRHR